VSTQRAMSVHEWRILLRRSSVKLFSVLCDWIQHCTVTPSESTFGGSRGLYAILRVGRHHRPLRLHKRP
jgi:hypothetical protein